MCVGNPTVNSYCRMWDFGFWAPVYKNWGWQNRTCTVRVASGGRFEYRGVDSSCNPYLTVAALLVAGLDGIRNEIDPGEPQSANTYDLLQEEGPRARARAGQPRRRAGRAREGRDRAQRDAGPPLGGVPPLQARRVGALPRGRHRLGARRVPGGAALVCGIAGIIYRDGGGEPPGRARHDAHAPGDEAPRARLDRLRALPPRGRRLRDAREARRGERPPGLRPRGAAAPLAQRDRGPHARGRAPRSSASTRAPSTR